MCRVENWRTCLPTPATNIRGTWGALARKSPDSEDARVFQSRMVDKNHRFRELKPRGDNDDATRQLVESRSPFLPMDSRLDVAPVHYIPTKDERAIRDSMRNRS